MRAQSSLRLAICTIELDGEEFEIRRAINSECLVGLVRLLRPVSTDSLIHSQAFDPNVLHLQHPPS